VTGGAAAPTGREPGWFTAASRSLAAVAAVVLAASVILLWPRPEDGIPAGSALRWSGPGLAGLALPLALALPGLRRRRQRRRPPPSPDPVGDLCAVLAVVLLLAGSGAAGAMAAASRTEIEVGGPVAGGAP
jgi:hypothetical protein